MPFNASSTLAYLVRNETAPVLELASMFLGVEEGGQAFLTAALKSCEDLTELIVLMLFMFVAELVPL